MFSPLNRKKIRSKGFPSVFIMREMDTLVRSKLKELNYIIKKKDAYESCRVVVSDKTNFLERLRKIFGCYPTHTMPVFEDKYFSRIFTGVNIDNGTVYGELNVCDGSDPHEIRMSFVNYTTGHTGGITIPLSDILSLLIQTSVTSRSVAVSEIKAV